MHALAEAAISGLDSEDSARKRAISRAKAKRETARVPDTESADPFIVSARSSSTRSRRIAHFRVLATPCSFESCLTWIMVRSTFASHENRELALLGYGLPLPSAHAGRKLGRAADGNLFMDLREFPADTDLAPGLQTGYIGH